MTKSKSHTSKSNRHSKKKNMNRRQNTQKQKKSLYSLKKKRKNINSLKNKKFRGGGLTCDECKKTDCKELIHCDQNGKDLCGQDDNDCYQKDC